MLFFLTFVISVNFKETILKETDSKTAKKFIRDKFKDI